MSSDLTTGALYPEVRQVLERPDRIRRVAFELMKHPDASLERLPESGQRYTTYLRRTDGAIKTIHIEIPDDIAKLARFSSHPAAVAALRGHVFERLVELLEDDTSFD